MMYWVIRAKSLDTEGSDLYLCRGFEFHFDVLDFKSASKLIKFSSAESVNEVALLQKQKWAHLNLAVDVLSSTDMCIKDIVE